ncbi:hypothetical protein [Pseudarthrobacter sp. SSS035]|uniref:hypothetical protein n=1 Tax=Pseudarthrobacter sp. SSS035 TaxID=2931399 RepID=UPI00200BB88B|nr:hypothetical protein [Pseudarthrobacter sp. SSS035]
MLRRGALAVIALVLSVLFGAVAAFAYWPASGTGSTTAAVATLAPPTGVSVPAISTSDVSVSWTAPTGGLAPTGYYVTRITSGTPAPACSSSPSALIATTSCTDISVPTGPHAYVVTAVHYSWTAVSTPSNNVSVISASNLTFESQPAGNVTAGSSIATLRVAARTLSGLVPVPDVPVTISIGSNPGGGTLSGTQLATTDATGVATFSNLSIDKAGTGYTLVASSPAYSGAVSTSFSVTAGTATQLVVTSPASVIGVASATANIGAFTVERRDTYGNPATGTAANVTLASGTPGTGLFATSANGTTGVTSVSIPPGLASTTFYYGNTKSGSTPFTASGIGQPVSVAVEITAAAASKLKLNISITPVPKNTPFNAAVAVVDPFDNQTQSTATVTLTSTGQGCPITIPAPNPKATTAGTASFTGLIVNGKRSGCQLTATSSGLTTVASALFDVD